MRLFDSIVDESRQHPNFRNLLRIRNGYTLDVINDWARGFEDRDGKFVQEFQTTFNSSFWELYLFAMLKRFSLRVDFSTPRPDFHISSRNFNIEAVIASHAMGAEPEYDRSNVQRQLSVDLNVSNRQTMLRLANSITSKHRKYLSEYASLDHVRERPFVIAVNNFDKPFGHMSVQRPIEAVLLSYYVDEDAYLAAGRPGGGLDGEELRYVPKSSGSAVELGLFTSPAYKEISAVIFNGCATMGKVRALSSDPSDGTVFYAFRLNGASDIPHIIREPKRRYEESLIDGLRIYHNPYATYPLDPAIFRHPSVFQIYHEHGVVRVEERDGLLLNRFLFTFVPKGTLTTTTV
jgi:hypothetical protein